MIDSRVFYDAGEREHVLVFMMDALLVCWENGSGLTRFLRFGSLMSLE